MTSKKYLICNLAVLAIIGSGCNYNVTNISNTQYVEQTSVSREVLASSVKKLNIDTYIDGSELSEYLDYFKTINKDTVAYIRLLDLGIDYPVVYNETSNNYYLRKNIYGEEDINGTIYIDYRCNPDTSTVTMLHGHNMKSGAQFAMLPELMKLKTLDYVPKIEYCDENGYRTYKIVSVFSLNSKSETINLEPLASAEEIKNMKAELVGRSIVPVSEVPEDLDMIILNTCWYGESGTERNLRCIVLAVRSM